MFSTVAYPVLEGDGCSEKRFSWKWEIRSHKICVLNQLESIAALIAIFLRSKLHCRRHSTWWCSLLSLFLWVFLTEAEMLYWCSPLVRTRLTWQLGLRVCDCVIQKCYGVAVLRWWLAIHVPNIPYMLAEWNTVTESHMHILIEGREVHGFFFFFF